MAIFHIEIRVMPKTGLLDPQGQAVEHALEALGFTCVDAVRIGKALTVDLDATDATAAERDARAMCERLLANPVTEDFTLHVEAR